MRLRIKNVSIQSPEGLLHPGSGQSQIHADMGRPMERTAVLPDNAHVPAHFQQFIQGHAMGSQPVGAVDKEHIGALGTEQGYAVEVIADIIHREIHIPRDDLPKLVCPLTALRAVGSDEGMNGFARGAVLGVADKVIEAVKTGAIRHFFLVAGCDGARPGRNYYTEFVRQTPADTVVLTLACGKYRFNDLDLGTIGGLPRLMDVGQCNDAYSAIQIAVALADAFGCGVNDLPLSMVLSWYEQKAVCILLTLLHLGIKNIRLGPTLPAFVSPNVLNYLVENFGIAPITTPEEDLKQLLK